jgi:phage-related protein
MASIYDTVPTWSAATTYNKYSIVQGSDNRYYYSIIDNNVGAGNNPVTSSNLGVDWDGYILLNGSLVPNFWWRPSYDANIRNTPKIIINQFGNGYEQRINDGINNNLINFILRFDNRNEQETVSILHFLGQRNGKESFVYNLPTIYAKDPLNLKTRFTCMNWESIYASYNNYQISCEFREVAA